MIHKDNMPLIFRTLVCIQTESLKVTLPATLVQSASIGDVHRLYDSDSIGF